MAVDAAELNNQEATQENASTDDRGTGATPSDQRSSESSPAFSRSPERDRPPVDWLRQALGRGDQQSGAAEAPPASVPASESDDSAQSDSQGQPKRSESAAAKTPEKPSPAQTRTQPFSVTPEELERRIQAEADRRLDKFQREEAQRRKATEERELREKDPYGYVELLKQREQEAEIVGKQLKAAQEFAVTNVRTYDSAVLDPIMAAVPAEERQRILGSIGDGIPGRAQAAAEAMKVLHKTWKDQGRAEARKVLLNDQAFVKEVLARFGGQRQEPESAPAVSSSGRSFNMNDLIRGAAGRG
jgi:hypothetical protein